MSRVHHGAGRVGKSSKSTTKRGRGLGPAAWKIGGCRAVGRRRSAWTTIQVVSAHNP